MGLSYKILLIIFSILLYSILFIGCVADVSNCDMKIISVNDTINKTKINEEKINASEICLNGRMINEVLVCP